MDQELGEPLLAHRAPLPAASDPQAGKQMNKLDRSVGLGGHGGVRVQEKGPHRGTWD